MAGPQLQAIEYRVPGFENVHPRGYFHCLALPGTDSRKWYRSFVALCAEKRGTGYFPVCRLGDGEFEFCLGKWIPAARQLNEPYGGYLYRYLRSTLTHMRSRYFKAGDRLPGLYTKDEWKLSRELAAGALREISEIGVLCPNFEWDDVQFAQQYYIPMLHWLSENKINLTEKNYYSFFFLYAMMAGPDRSKILADSKVLVVTAFDESKMNRLKQNLLSDGCSSVQFVNISSERSMYDTLDLSGIELPVDVVLLGAGVGKFNVMPQLSVTNTICLDIGFVMEIYADPEIRNNEMMARVFTVCD